jgi:hypothetical protein
VWGGREHLHGFGKVVLSGEVIRGICQEHGGRLSAWQEEDEVEPGRVAGVWGGVEFTVDAG